MKPSRFLEQYSICFDYIFMNHISGFKMHDFADDLQRSAHTKYGNDCADANRAAQYPANEKGDADHDGLHHADGGFRETLAKSDQQRITGAAALCCVHIEILPVTHDEQTNDDHDTADRDAVELRQGDEMVDEINIVSHQKGIQNGTITDFFLQQYVDTQNHDADDGMDDAITHAYPIGRAHRKAVPWRQPNISLNGQEHADGKDKQPEGGFQYFFYHLYFCLHRISPVNARPACLFFCGKGRVFAFVCRSVYFNTLQTAFQYQLTQERVVHEGAFQQFQPDFDTDF